jgi:hypothetical protein
MFHRETLLQVRLEPLLAMLLTLPVELALGPERPQWVLERR